MRSHGSPNPYLILAMFSNRGGERRDSYSVTLSRAQSNPRLRRRRDYERPLRAACSRSSAVFIPLLFRIPNHLLRGALGAEPPSCVTICSHDFAPNTISACAAAACICHGSNRIDTAETLFMNHGTTLVLPRSNASTLIISTTALGITDPRWDSERGCPAASKNFVPFTPGYTVQTRNQHELAAAPREVPRAIHAETARSSRHQHLAIAQRFDRSIPFLRLTRRSPVPASRPSVSRLRAAARRRA